MNVFATEDVLSDYQAWGYPSWFHYVTGGLEWTSAVLIAVPTTRLIGSLLGGAVMCAALVTLLLHGEVLHAAAPLVAFAFVTLNAWITLSHRGRAGEET